MAVRTSDDDEEVAGALGWTVARVVQVEAWGRPTTSLDGPLDDGSTVVLADRQADGAAGPEAVDLDLDLKRAVPRLLAHLDAREQVAVMLRFGLDRMGDCRTLPEVGVLMSLSSERVRQIESRALAKLRHPAHPTAATTRSLLD